MAAVAPSVAQTATVDDALVQKFVRYLNTHPESNDMTLDEIHNTISASLSEPDGRANLEQLLSPPEAEVKLFNKFAFGESVVDLALSGLKLEFRLNSDVPGSDVKVFSASSSILQLIKGRFPGLHCLPFILRPKLLTKRRTKMAYDDAKELLVANPMTAVIRQLDSPLRIEVDIKTAGGPMVARLFISGTNFRIQNCSGPGSWS